MIHNFWGKPSSWKTNKLSLLDYLELALDLLFATVFSAYKKAR